MIYDTNVDEKYVVFGDVIRLSKYIIYEDFYSDNDTTNLQPLGWSAKYANIKNGLGKGYVTAYSGV